MVEPKNYTKVAGFCFLAVNIALFFFMGINSYNLFEAILVTALTFNATLLTMYLWDNLKPYYDANLGVSNDGIFIFVTLTCAVLWFLWICEIWKLLSV